MKCDWSRDGVREVAGGGCVGVKRRGGGPQEVENDFLRAQMKRCGLDKLGVGGGRRGLEGGMKS